VASCGHETRPDAREDLGIDEEQEARRGRREEEARPAKKPAPRADLGAPVDGWFATQPQPQRAILAALRDLGHDAAPEAVGSLKWGMPFFTVGGMLCAFTSHRGHVNLILPGPPGSFADPGGRLEGDGKTGRHLKLRTLEDLQLVPPAVVGQRDRTGVDGHAVGDGAPAGRRT
jgi:hypothetical protein